VVLTGRTHEDLIGFLPAFRIGVTHSPLVVRSSAYFADELFAGLVHRCGSPSASPMFVAVMMMMMMVLQRIEGM
jgi:hypothetical protein